MATTRIPYGDHPSQWIEVSVPEDAADGPLPVIIFLHGGYWRDLHAADQGEALIADLVAHRVIAVNVEYRRVGTDPVHGAGGWPQTFLDVAAAIDRLGEVELSTIDGLAPAPADRTGSEDARVDLDRVDLDRPDLDRLDLDRVVLIGHSAGGQLAAWLAARPGLPAGSPGAIPRVRPLGYVSLAGVLDLVAGADDHLDDDAVQGLLGGNPADLPEIYARASPIARLPIGVPGVCLHGTHDNRVPYEQSVRYVDAAVAAGDSCRLIRLPGVDHFAYLDPTTPAWRSARTEAFDLLRQLP